MVKSEIIEKENCRRVLKVEIPADEVKTEFDKVFQGIVKNAVVPGFRKGKVPFSMVKTRYAEAAREEVMRNLISSSFYDAVKEKNMEILTEPMVEKAELKPEEAFSYKASFEVRPEIKLGDYNKLKLTKKTKKITREDIDNSLKDIQERFARYVAVDKELASNDDALVDIRIVDEGKEILNREGIIIRIDDESFGKGFSEKVKGLKRGGEREFLLKAPIREGDKTIEKEMNFRVRLREVKEKQLSPVDDELAKDVGFDSLEKLKEDIRERLEILEEEKAYRGLIRQIDEHLLSIGDLVPPESAVRDREEFLLEEMRHNFEHAGRKDEYKAREEELRKGARESSLRRVKLAYLLDEAGRRENIKAGKEEVEADLKMMFGDNKEEVRKARERLTKEKAWGNYALRIRERKIYQYLIDKAEIAEDGSRRI